jgi:uncharacterized protein (TIGR02246 family)
MPQAAVKEAVASLTAEDRLDIQQLISEYSFHEDSGDAAAWAALFTSDGSFIGAGRPPVTGTAALVAFARKRWERPEVRARTHWVSNIVIRPTAQGAAAESYQLTVDKIGKEFRITSVAGKSDELRRENGKWRFHIRRAVPVGGGA